LLFVNIFAFGSSQRILGAKQRCFKSSDFDASQITLPAGLSGSIVSDLQDIIQKYLDTMPVVCTNFTFEMCSDPPRMHINISVDGEIKMDQYITENTEYCRNAELSVGECTPCIGIKPKSLVLNPNYAHICPDYRL